MPYLLNHIIENAAASFPTKVAFKSGEKRVTYHELLTISKLVASVLLRNGIQKEDRVGIYLNRCIETAFAMFGIMKAGCVYVPLDHENPAQRNAFIINDCGIKAIVTRPAQKRGFSKVLAQEDVQLDLVIGMDIEGIKSVSWEQFSTNTVSLDSFPELDEEDPAYILYTSGSTGNPKGIVHPHKSGVGYAELSVDFFDIKENDILGNHAAINFDIATFGFFAGPLAGATTVIVPDPHIKMPASLLQLIAREKISIWYSVPSALIKLLDLDDFSIDDFSDLRWVMFAGELFPTPQLKELMSRWPKARFTNAFGPTEVNACTYLTLDKVPETDEPISIGKPWDRTEILIVDDDDREVVKGEIGELLVSTITMMSGYWNDLEKTRKSHFFKGAKVFYRTGDLVQERPDGNLTFFGRKDRQIKLRGFRIELDEIHAVLWRHPNVKDAAVFVNQSNLGEKQIAAVVVLAQYLESNEIRQYCSQYLSHYALPQEIIVISEIPRNSRGKIDYQQLEEKYTVSKK